MAGAEGKPDYQPGDMAATCPEAVRAAFENQTAYCRANNAPITARVVAAVLAAIDSEADNELLRRIRTWAGAPLADALPLRIAGGLHALHIAGVEPALAPLYRGDGADDAGLVLQAITTHEARLLPWLDGPPQTNEAGRSSNFVAAMLWLAGQSLPPRFDCLEIGSSAGINLMLGRYGYDLGGVRAGPDDAVMQFAPVWEGAPPPDLPIEFMAMEGCDVAPVDLTDPVQALRLRAYIWPEHTVRFERLDAAILAACESAPAVVPMNAADFVESRLAVAQQPGSTRVLIHSIVWQYLPGDQQRRIEAAMAAAGARATAGAPLAWIALEANRSLHRHVLTVRYWPSAGAEKLLARAHAHGAEIEWLA